MPDARSIFFSQFLIFARAVNFQKSQNINFLGFQYLKICRTAKIFFAQNSFQTTIRHIFLFHIKLFVSVLYKSCELGPYATEKASGKCAKKGRKSDPIKKFISSLCLTFHFKHDEIEKN